MIRRLLVPCLITMIAAAAAVVAADFEKPPILQASDLLPEEILEGPRHRVEPEVRNDGLMNHYQVESDFGNFEASGDRIVAMRVVEVQALDKLEEMSRTDAFVDAMKQAALRPVRMVENIATDPVGTAKAVPGGIKRKFKGYMYVGRKAADQAKDLVTKDDEEKAAEEAAEGGGEEDPSRTEQAGDAAKGAAKDYLGWNQTKRQLARSLNVDPYTDNEILQQELNRVSQAAFVANLGVRFGMPGIPGMSYVSDVNQMIYQYPPSELERQNDEALKKAGIEKDARLEFFKSPSWPLSLETNFAQSIRWLEGVENRGVAVELATQADDAKAAYFFTTQARLLLAHHLLEEPLAHLEMLGNEEVGRVIVGVTGDNRLILPLAFDYIIWLEGFGNRGPVYDWDDRLLLLSGRVSDRARSEVEARDWAIKTQALDEYGEPLAAKLEALVGAEAAKQKDKEQQEGDAEDEEEAAG